MSTSGTFIYTDNINVPTFPNYINNTNNDFFGIIENISGIGPSYTHSVDYSYSDNGNNDGLVPGATSITITQFDNIPLTRSGSQFLNFTGQIAASDTPTILSNTSLFSCFFGTGTLISSNYGDVGNWNVTNAINMEGMFFNATNFNEDISSWNVSNVTVMDSMFRGASSFNQNISSWNVSNVNDMNNMFNGASNFNQNISGWDVSNVTDMNNMFNSAISFNQNISGWNVSNVTDYTSMFDGANVLSAPLELWTVQQTDTLTDMFFGASAMAARYGPNITTYGDTPDYTFFNQSSPYCVLEGTIIKTDQGEIKIEDINKKGFSINGVPIIGRSKEFYKRKRLIFFKKDCLGPNIPNDDTYISEAHQILYNNELLSCKKIMNQYPELNLKYVHYDTEPTVYNLFCEEYINMNANNIIMETLEHCHKDKTYKIKFF